MSETVVMGAGSWGTAIACLIADHGVGVQLWCRDESRAELLRSARENAKYLPGIRLAESIRPISQVPKDADLWIIAAPSSGFSDVCDLVPQGASEVLIATKGLDVETAHRMGEILQSKRPEATIGALSGPNLALEVARGIPTAAVIASTSPDFCSRAQKRIATRTFRVYTTSDVVGVELGGALKNVYALGAGMSDGLGFGDNTKGAFLARALREMALLGTALGAEHRTFLGLSGVGDLFATSASKLSRNYRVGRLLAEGLSAEAAVEKIGQVAEGIPTSAAALILSAKTGVPIPLIQSIRRVVKSEVSPLEALAELMDRPAGAEFD